MKYYILKAELCKGREKIIKAEKLSQAHPVFTPDGVRQANIDDYLIELNNTYIDHGKTGWMAPVPCRKYKYLNTAIYEIMACDVFEGMYDEYERK